MASVLITTAATNPGPPNLREGDRLTQPEFHRRYLDVKDETRFELIQGVVCMGASMKVPHNDYVGHLVTQAVLYSRRVPGVHCGAGATVILDEQNEPEPDVFLRLQPGLGGSSTNTEVSGGFIQGPPELVIEVADRSLFRDLHQKKDAYEHAGVKEYIVVCVEQCEVKWFTWPAGERVIPDDKILKSVVFPGFWIDVESLFQLDGLKLEDVLFRGIATAECQAFQADLQRRLAESKANSQS